MMTTRRASTGRQVLSPLRQSFGRSARSPQWMNQDLTSRADIDALMVRFYSRAMTDPAIGHFFTEVVKLDLEHHLPVIGDFWESVLFGTGVYARHGRHPLMVHGEISGKRQLEPQHFARWMELFEESIDELFEGRSASYMKQRARAIAGRMLEFVSTGN